MDENGLTSRQRQERENLITWYKFRLSLKWKFFLRFGLPSPTVARKASFYKRSPEWRVFKTLASRLRVDGRRRKRKFSNLMMSYITNITHALWGMLSYFDWTGKTIQIHYLWRRIFLKTEENISPWSGYVWRGSNLSVSRRTVPYAKIPCGFSVTKEVRAHVRTDVQKATPLGRQDSVQSIGNAEAYISLLLLDLH